MNIIIGRGNHRQVFQGVSGAIVRSAPANERKAYHGHLCQMLNIDPKMPKRTPRKAPVQA